jgi:glycosyltransferase involved in cell wall biosynthesis
MAVKLILTQIMKNESHVAHRMLDSIKSIVDGICIIDTGSTDDSIEVVQKWGRDNGIETHVFERPFDNFEDSRNFSFQKAREMFLNRGDSNTYYNFWLDFDETIELSPNFNKQKIDRDLYMFTTYINNMKYTRNEMCRLDKKFKFYGPVHEFIVSEEPNMTTGLLEGLVVRVKMDGGSWLGDIPAKYLSHAHKLEEYINKDRKDPRWIFYTAQSYHDSASTPNNREENEERWRRSLKYYRERVSRPDGYPEEIFYSQYRIGMIMRSMEEPWNLCLNELLKAYSMDPARGEPTKAIIDHYLSLGEFNNAYLFSKFARVTYHEKNPYPKRLLFVDESLYAWKFLEVYSAACFYTNRKEEAKAAFNEMVKISKQQPHLFTQEDLMKLESNSKAFNTPIPINKPV